MHSLQNGARGLVPPGEKASFDVFTGTILVRFLDSVPVHWPLRIWFHHPYLLRKSALNTTIKRRLQRPVTRVGFHQLQQRVLQRPEAEGREEVNDFTASEGKRGTELLGECRSNDYGVSEPIPQRTGTAIPNGFGRTSARPFSTVAPSHQSTLLTTSRGTDRGIGSTFQLLLSRLLPNANVRTVRAAVIQRQSNTTKSRPSRVICLHRWTEPEA